MEAATLHPVAGKYPAMVVWLTGFSGAGKSTIAEGLERSMRSEGIIPMIIDGDRMREELCSDLGFTEEDRRENIRRAGAIALMAARSGIMAICSLISPLRQDRDEIRQKCQKRGVAFMEVYVSTLLSTCEQRDPKGLYRKARAGLIRNFTGIDSIYEPPLHPEVVIPTENHCIESAISVVTAAIKKLHVNPTPQPSH